jgi:ubiquinone/menaquinone biosynthesis C-methylase UbiE
LRESQNRILPVMTHHRRDIETRYDRIASVYDMLDAVPERLFYRAWRRRLWEKVVAQRILEVGVGTGKNMRYYPKGAQVTAIDISSRMLEKAAGRIASRPDVDIELLKMDVRELNFDDASFDAVVGSFLVTVVPEPLEALQEVRRVCKPEGNLRVLEFTRSENKMVGFVQGLVTPLTRAVYGANVGRDTVTLVQRGGFQIIEVEELVDGLVRIIHAAPQ